MRCLSRSCARAQTACAVSGAAAANSEWRVHGGRPSALAPHKSSTAGPSSQVCAFVRLVVLSMCVVGGWWVGVCGGVVSAGCRHHVVGTARPCADGTSPILKLNGMTTRSTRGCGSWQQGHPLTAKSRPDPVHARGAHPECEFLGRLQSARTHSATWVARSGLWRTAGPHVACDAAIM